MTAGAPVRIGLIGAGWVTRHHLDAYRALGPRVTVAAIADPLAGAREARAAEYGIPKTYADAAEMLDAEALDAVDIASPRESHAAHARLAASRGLAILCQKPLAPTFAEAEVLIAEIGTRVPFMVHENWRFRPHYRQIKAWLDAGRIGRPAQALMQLFTSGLVPEADGGVPALDRQPMLRPLERMLLMEVMIHHVDTLRFLLGPLALRAAALGKVSRDIRGEDHATLVLAAADGAAVVLIGNFSAHGHPPEQKDRLEILGERGAISLDGNVLELHGAQPERLELDLAANYAASYRNAIACFLDGLANGRIAENRAEDNLETLRIVEAAYAGMSAGSPEPVTARASSR
jgi:predicted dehydrogenase